MLSLFFLKHVTDIWWAQAAVYRERYPQEPALVEALMACQPLVVPVRTDFGALIATRHRPGLTMRIAEALRVFENVNAASLGGLFRDCAFDALHRVGSAEDATLDRLFSAVAELPRLVRGTPADANAAAGAACRAFLRAADDHDRTVVPKDPPADVCRLIACLAAPKAGETVCDPSGGRGMLLVACARHERASRRPIRRWRDRPETGLALLAQAPHADSGALARLNLLLHGERNHRIQPGDGLREPLLADDRRALRRFDLVVGCWPDCGGPWRADDDDRADPFSRFPCGLPPAKRPEFAHLMHVVACLETQRGRAVVVLPQGVLFRGGVEGRIRRRLLAENLIDAVISLPARLFPGGTAPAVLVLRRAKADRSVLFVDARHLHAAGPFGSRLSSDDAARIVELCAVRRSEAGTAWLATPEDIERNDFDLHVPRYLGGGDTDGTAGQAAPTALGGWAALAALTEERHRLKATAADVDRRVDALFRGLRHD